MCRPGRLISQAILLFCDLLGLIIPDAVHHARETAPVRDLQ